MLVIVGAWHNSVIVHDQANQYGRDQMASLGRFDANKNHTGADYQAAWDNVPLVDISDDLGTGHRMEIAGGIVLLAAIAYVAIRKA